MYRLLCIMLLKLRRSPFSDIMEACQCTLLLSYHFERVAEENRKRLCNDEKPGHLLTWLELIDNILFFPLGIYLCNYMTLV